MSENDVNVNDDSLRNPAHSDGTTIPDDREVLINMCQQFNADLEIIQQLSAPDQPVLAIEADLVEIEKIKEKFLQANLALSSVTQKLDPTAVPEIQVQRKDFLLTYRSIRNELLSFKSAAPASFASTPSVPSSELKMPRIEIKEFDGSFLHWPEFKQLFEALVMNGSFSESVKYHYLRTFLKGEPLNLIKKFPFDPIHFQECWRILLEYYDDPINELQQHLHALQTLPTLATQLKTEQRTPALRSLINNFRQHVNAMSNIGRHHDHIDIASQILIHWFLTKVSRNVRIEWFKEVKKSADPTTVVTFDTFLEFIDSQCKAEESAGNSLFFPANAQSAGKKKPQTKPVAAAATQSKPAVTNQPKPRDSVKPKNCVFCNKTDHYVSGCEQFKGTEPNRRIQFAEEKKLCRFCLRTKCNIMYCYKRPCKTCQGDHNTLLHPESSKQVIVHPSIDSLPQQLPILATSLCSVLNPRTDERIIIRALLDQASQCNIIRESVVKKLGVEVYPNVCPITGVGAHDSTATLSTRIKLFSNYSDFSLEIVCLIMSTIVPVLPNCQIHTSNWNIPQWSQLADPLFYLPAEIDVLIGSNIFWKILKDRSVRLGEKLPKLWETELGWIIADDVPRLPESNQVVGATTIQQVYDLIEHFWKVDEGCESVSNLPNNAFDFESFYQSTTRRAADNRFIVSLPFVQSASALGDSYAQALHRFKSLEKRFARDEGFKNKYVEIIREYIDLNHLVKIDSSQINTVSYYVPHFAVLSESSTSTPSRVVFDFSAKTTRGPSLNDILAVGPFVQPELISTFLRFRFYKFAITADIVKMFRQIYINDKHTQFQRIVWRESEKESIQIYEHKRVTFGMNCSPFLATRTLNQIADELPDSMSNVKDVIRNDFYVDNLLTGADSLKEAQRVQRSVTELLKEAGFELSKWASNNSKFMQTIPDEHRESQFPLAIGDRYTIKTLGVLWEPDSDYLKIWLHPVDPNAVSTKRGLLSCLAGLYDPCGFVSPVVTRGKIFMQETWRLKSEDGRKRLDWDDELPENLLRAWRQYASTLSNLAQHPIQRYIFSPFSVKPQFVELHGFADASEKAYGAVLYLRAGANGEILVTPLASRSRLAPIKFLTVARLELLAALLLSKLTKQIYDIVSMKCEVKLVRLWSDSTIVLSWLQQSASNWQTWVANRVQQIQNLPVKCTWDHVSGKENPADVISRGADANELISHDLWWNGPDWLSAHSGQWTQKQNFSSREVNLPERKILKVSAASLIQRQICEFNLFQKFSSLNKLLRVTAFCFRFCKNARVQIRHLDDPLQRQEKGRLRRYDEFTVPELEKARNALIKLAQAQTFSNEIISLTRNKPLPTKSPLKSGVLTPFVDKNGILRVGAGRLSRSELSYDQMHPAILMGSHTLSHLIVEDEHIRLGHAGPRLLGSSLRQRFHIIRANNLIKKIYRSCVRCRRYRSSYAHTQHQIMGSLPPERVILHRPFSVVGVDYTGAINYIEIPGRGRRLTVKKAYIAVFVCFAVKAIHLELVTDLSTKAFLAALDRFIARRGMPSKMESDNGTNFVGAAAELKSLRAFLDQNKDTIFQYTAKKGIDWSFIPPYSPTFGGLWEAGVKSVKTNLKLAIGNRQFTFEQYVTLLANIEAYLNSRPLYNESMDPSDNVALTPGHFLIGQPLTTLPKPSIVDIPIDRLKYWEQIQHVSESFWKRWSREYLNTLNQRTKWRKEKDELKVGEIVLIREDQLLPSMWPLARITKIYPGLDGHTRVVDLQTATDNPVAMET